MIGFVATVGASLPSPPSNGFSLGPVRFHIYGVMIAVAVGAAVWLAQRRWSALGGRPGTMANLAVWGVPGGLIGARLYSVVTSYQQDTSGHFLRVFEIWRGGLGIWGGVLGGVLAGILGLRRSHLPIRPALDCVAPAFPLAQAIGRWGNYFNQELFGRPTSLPWGLQIAPQYRPAGYAQYTTFQPTFLYEFCWDLIVCGLLLLAAERLRIRRGYLFALYASLYTFGRFFIEYLRIDDAHRWLGLRLNDWTSIVVFVLATALLAWRGRPRPGDDLVGDPLPASASVAPASVAPSEPSDPSDPSDAETPSAR